MAAQIQPTDIKLHYVTIVEAKKMSGLRLVLGAYPVPGPWREACKGLFYVKGIPYKPVVTGNEGTSDLQIGMDDSQSELVAWTGQASAPVAIWNDELPRSKWIDQLNLAERLEPEPRLIPEDSGLRMQMFGLINELAGENGLLWLKRLGMAHAPLQSLPEGHEGRAFWEFLGAKYGYTPERAEAAPARIVNTLNSFHEQFDTQNSRGSKYLIGDSLTAVDIYWSTTCGLLDPLPDDLCPMTSGFRNPSAYGCDNAEIDKALTPELRAHREFIYNDYLELPIVF